MISQVAGPPQNQGGVNLLILGIRAPVASGRHSHSHSSYSVCSASIV